MACRATRKESRQQPSKRRQSSSASAALESSSKSLWPTHRLKDVVLGPDKLSLILEYLPYNLPAYLQAKEREGELSLAAKKVRQHNGR
jgi:hypothetical protein